MDKLSFQEWKIEVYYKDRKFEKKLRHFHVVNHLGKN